MSTFYYIVMAVLYVVVERTFFILYVLIMIVDACGLTLVFFKINLMFPAFCPK